MSLIYQQFHASVEEGEPNFSLFDNLDPAEEPALNKALLADLHPVNILALGYIDTYSAVPVIRKILKSENHYRRLAAARVLWRLDKSEEGFHIFQESIEDDTEGLALKFYSINLLGTLHHPRSFAMLEAAFLDKHFMVRLKAAQAFSRICRKKSSLKEILRGIEAYDREKIKRFSKRMRKKI